MFYMKKKSQQLVQTAKQHPPPISPVGDRRGICLPRQQHQQRRLIKRLSAPSVFWQTNYQSQQFHRRPVVRNIDRQGQSGSLVLSWSNLVARCGAGGDNLSKSLTLRHNSILSHILNIFFFGPVYCFSKRSLIKIGSMKKKTKLQTLTTLIKSKILHRKNTANIK